jgi:hypothetical protein
MMDLGNVTYEKKVTQWIITNTLLKKRFKLKLDGKFGGKTRFYCKALEGIWMQAIYWKEIKR